MKNIAMLFRLAALTAVGVFFVAGPSQLTAQPAPEAAPTRPASPEDLSKAELLQSYLQVREQLHATQLAIANNRAEAEAVARTQAAAITDKLEAIKVEMNAERERHQRETQRINAERDRQQIEMYRLNSERARQQAEAERSNRNVLWIAAAFGGLGLLAMIALPLIQWRTLNRMAEVTALRAPEAVPRALPGDAGTEASDRMVASSNQRLLSVIDRMERRIFELEQTAAPSPSAAPAASANPFAAPDALRTTIPISDQAARISMLFTRGRSYLDAGKAREALACFDEILKLDLNNPNALVKRGTALERLEQDKEALLCYDRAIKADPKMTIAYLYKGGVCNRLQRYEEALQCYEQALRAEEEGKQSGASRSPLPGPWPAARGLSAS
jgi:tetratricopeptide (TPR) repeat protein